jgi:hypothetical protein
MSTVGYGPPWRIDGPPPIAPLYGLLPAAMAPAAGVRLVVDLDGEPFDLLDLAGSGETMDATIARLKAEGILPANAGQERWINGVEVYPYPPDVPDVYDTCAPGSEATTKGFGADLEHPQFRAVTLWLAETCSSSRIWDQDAFKARAVVALAVVESYGIAHELLHGTRVPVNPHFSDGNGDFPNGDTPTSVANGLALLEDYLAGFGRLGLIHCSPGVATVLRERFTVDNRSGVIRTINGNVVVPDPGYVGGATPHGHPGPGAHQEWIFASGPVDLRRSEIFTNPETVAEALDRGTGGATTGRPNSITYRAERYYLADWDTQVQAAVLVDRCDTDC